MHICSFLHFTNAICKGFFCYGIYNKNGMCSKVPVSDVKDYASPTPHSPLLPKSCFGSKNLRRMSQFYLIGTPLHICRNLEWYMSTKVFYEVAVQEICEQESCAMSLASTQTIFGLTSCLLLHLSSRFMVMNLFDISPKLFLKFTSIAMLADNWGRKALSPHLVYNCVWPWVLSSPTQIETCRPDA